MKSAMEKIVYIGGVLLYTRPFFHILTILTLLTGYVLSREYSGWEQVLTAVVSWVVLGSGGCLALNTYFDNDSSSTIPLGFMPSKPVVHEKHLLYVGVLLMFSGLVLSLLVNLVFSMLYILSFLLSILYSAPPLRLKGKTGLDLFTNAAGYGSLTFLSGWFIYGTWETKTLFLAILFFFIFASGYLSTAIYHIAHDKANNTLTLAATMGVRRSMVASAFLIAVTGFLVIAAIWMEYLRPLSVLVFIPIGIAMGNVFTWCKNPTAEAKKHMYIMYLTALLGLLSLIYGELCG